MALNSPDRPAALILQHGRLGPPGLLADWLRARGIGAVVHHVEPGAGLPTPDRFAFVASLGSAKSPNHRDDRLVIEELDLIARCVDREIPVLGLCFGGQALASVLGGTVEVLDAPELGWHRIESAAPDVVAGGPWLQWHFEAFRAPPGAEELARSPVCSQAFRFGPHLGTQFHPESTAVIVEQWARHDQTRLPGSLEEHLDHLRTGADAHGAAAEQAAVRLFDAFWARCPAAVAGETLPTSSR
jgi:GMP synthase-like glutamine amidotransferase